METSMPTIQNSIAAALFSAALFSASGALAAQKNYTLVCNGQGMSAHYDMKYPLFNAPTVQVFFKKSSWAASQKKPLPNNCAWVDRPLSASEPSYFFFKNVGTPFGDVTVTSDGMEATLHRGGGSKRTAQAADMMLAIRQGRLFYVQAHLEPLKNAAPAQNSLIISRVGP